MAEIPKLELDPQWFTILASSPTAAIVRHNLSGNIDIWRLEWRHRDGFPSGMSAEAWEKYLKVMNE